LKLIEKKNFFKPCIPSPCSVNSNCVANSFNQFTCSCFPGYTGVYCESQINYCSSNPCMNGTCVNGLYGFDCNCYPGYVGALCQIDINECYSNPCQNGGICSEPYPNMYLCTCPGNYQGVQCLSSINPCLGNTCRNGATCVASVNQNTYQCLCQFGMWTIIL